MNEINIKSSSNNYFAIISIIILVALICSGLLYYYRGTDSKLKSELNEIEELNVQIASQSRQLQAEIASHSERIKTVGNKVSKSRERIEHVYTSIVETAIDTETAIEIINKCEKILEKIKTQRQN